MKKRPRRKRFVVVLGLLVGGTWLFFWWPRPAPGYIQQPEGHGDVRVETWISWGVFTYYRQFYVSTEVFRPWEDVLAELTQGKDVRELQEFIDVVKPDIERSERFQQANRAALDRWEAAKSAARPSRSGGFGDPLPDSFVVFVVLGPEDNKHGRHHRVTYRLTIRGPKHTLVEVWDNQFLDL